MTDVVYYCENCGNTNDKHTSKPAGHKFKPACIDCGATALRRELAE